MTKYDLACSHFENGVPSQFKDQKSWYSWLSKELDLPRGTLRSYRSRWKKRSGYDQEVVREELDEAGIDLANVPYYWYKSKLVSAMVRQDQKEPIKELEDKFEAILEKVKIGKYPRFKPKKVSKHRALKCTITDDHVGMNPNPNNNALFKYQYNAVEYRKSMEKVYQAIMKEHAVYGTFDVLYLDNLGDQEDGWNQETERGGHELPQNMSNADVFETILDAKLILIRNLVDAGVANKIVTRCVSNSNHSAEFALIVSKALKKVVNLLYDEELVEVDIIKRFIEHRMYGDHCFLLTHGKDKKEMRSGLPLNLNDKTINYVNQYIDHYDINAKYIHLEKGDLHQIGYQRTKKFDYRNFMSFAPPSNWVQHNFGDSYSGFSIQVIPKNSPEISHTDYYLDYKKEV